jgi:hypothetical protein
MHNDSDMGGMLLVGIVIGVCLVLLFLGTVFEMNCESENNVYDCTMQYVPTEVTPDATN